MRILGNWLLVLAIIGAAVGAVLPFATPQSVMAMTGSGTSGDPWIIMDVADLQAIGTGSYALNHYYELGGDIDASATATWNWDAGRSVYAGFAPIGTFAGNFDGNGYAITDLHIDRYYTTEDAEVGLFSRTSGSALISRVMVLDADITVAKESPSSTGTVRVGILVGGLLGGQVADCGTSGSVTVTWSGSWGVVCGVGGLAGTVKWSGTRIDRSFSYASVDFRILSGIANAATGGLVGYMRASLIANSYARGAVYGYRDGASPPVGGLVGTVYQATLDDCYSTGLVSGGSGTSYLGGLVGSHYMGSATNSFWDTYTSGQSTSVLGTAKSHTQMKTQSTFTGAGWDFTTIWVMSTYVNDGYPYLLWWYDPADPVELTADIYQVVHFQPNTIISGTTLPNLAQGGGVHPNGTFSWGSNPAGIDIRGPEDFGPEDPDYDVLTPGTWDIIEPEPTGIVGGIDLDRLADNPMSPFVQVLSSSDLITERLAWLLLAIFIVIAAMVATQLLGQHMVFTSLVGFGLTALFYSMGVWGMWVVILMAFGLVASIVYERMPTL